MGLGAIAGRYCVERGEKVVLLGQMEYIYTQVRSCEFSNTSQLLGFVGLWWNHMLMIWCQILILVNLLFPIS